MSVRPTRARRTSFARSFVVTLATIVVTVLLVRVADAAPRRAFLVGSREGNSDQALLRYTTDDVHRLAGVLTELGGVPRASVTELADPSAANLAARLDALASVEKSELFVFYYSGHADGANLLLGGTALPLADLLAKIAAVPADLRIIVLDACQSGAAARTKGVGIAAPFDIRTQGQTSSGDVLITSSSASEASYESDSARSGVFSLHLATGLRGVADVDRDGAVTISEAYQYAYAQTLRSTMLAASGPQHASFRYALAGQRDPALTRIAAATHLTLRAVEDGEFILFDDQESRVFAEVRVEKERQARLALASGRYVVRKRGLRDLRTARIALSVNDERILDEAEMPATALMRLPPKGGLGSLSLGLSAGQYWSALGERGHGRFTLGPEWERGTWLFRTEGVFAFGTQIHNELETPQQSVGVAVSALTGVRFGSVFLRGGPLLGPEIVFQQPEGRPSRTGMGVRLGPRLRVDVPLSRNIGLYGVVDATLLATRADGRLPGLTMRTGDVGWFGSVAYALGIVTAF